MFPLRLHTTDSHIHRLSAVVCLSKHPSRSATDAGGPGSAVENTPSEPPFSPMLLGAGDQAPRPSRLIGLPITRRPLFPTTAYPYTITNPDVVAALAESSQVSLVGFCLQLFYFCVTKC